MGLIKPKIVSQSGLPSASKIGSTFKPSSFKSIAAFAGYKNIF